MSCPVVAILGPTASGKSDLAQHVALRIDGEVVSADSMQVYRGMDIGTAKIPQTNMLVPHHLIDILDPGEAFSAQLFQSLSRFLFFRYSKPGQGSNSLRWNWFVCAVRTRGYAFPERGSAAQSCAGLNTK